MECPPPSAAVLWFLNVRETTQIEKKVPQLFNICILLYTSACNLTDSDPLQFLFLLSQSCLHWWLQKWLDLQDVSQRLWEVIHLGHTDVLMKKASYNKEEIHHWTCYLLMKVKPRLHSLFSSSPILFRVFVKFRRFRIVLPSNKSSTTVV